MIGPHCVAAATAKSALQRLKSLRQSAQIVIPQAPFAGGICFFLNICTKSRSFSASRARQNAAGKKKRGASFGMTRYSFSW
jgi:hypothetical protein